MALETVSVRADKKLWKKWLRKLKRQKIRPWDRIEPVIKKDLEK